MGRVCCNPLTEGAPEGSGPVAARTHRYASDWPCWAGKVCGVREGTRVLTCPSPADEAVPPCSPPVNGGTRRTGARAPAEAAPKHTAIPIEDIRVGDHVFAHDGQPHRVLRVARSNYRGPMVAISHALSPDPLWVTAELRVLCQRRTLSYGAKRSWGHVPRDHFARSRELRREMTPAERRLWTELRRTSLGVKFRRQHPIGPWIADFYSWEAGLVVEVDGDSHFTPEAISRDAERTEYLEALGLRVLRVTNEDVFRRREAVVQHILEALLEALPSDDHYRQWRCATTLKAGDVVFFARDLEPVEISVIEQAQTGATVYGLELERACSFVTTVCAVHGCGRVGD